MAATRAALLFLLAIAAATGPCRCAAGRALRQDSGYVGGRVVGMKPAKTPVTSRSAMTPEAAESTSSSSHAGTHRLMAPPSRRSYATVNVNQEFDNKDASVQPRARSAQDLPRGGPNRSNGAPNMPAMVMGGVAHAQTYMGATAVASTDSLALNRGGRGMAIAANMVTTRQPVLKRTQPNTAWAVTAQPVTAWALSGQANGHMVLAQANSAVALAQAQKSSKYDD